MDCDDLLHIHARFYDTEDSLLRVDAAQPTADVLCIFAGPDMKIAALHVEAGLSSMAEVIQREIFEDQVHALRIQRSPLPIRHHHTLTGLWSVRIILPLLSLVELRLLLYFLPHENMRGTNLLALFPLLRLPDTATSVARFSSFLVLPPRAFNLPPVTAPILQQF